MDSERLSSPGDDFFYCVREIGRKGCDVYGRGGGLVPDRWALTTLTPLSGEGGLPVAGGRDEENDPRGRLVQQPRQTGPLDEVALRSDEFDGRFADGAPLKRSQIPLPQD
jgi:hypothetical protein